MDKPRSRMTESASLFYVAMAELSWTGDGVGFTRQELDNILEKAEEVKKRNHASVLGIGHLSTAFFEVYKWNDDYDTWKSKIRTKAKALKGQWGVSPRHHGLKFH